MSADPLDETQREALVAYFDKIAPWLMPHFAGTPLVAAFFAEGLGSQPTFAASLHSEHANTLKTVNVITTGGEMAYLALDENSIRWELHRGAIEFHSWTPALTDPERVRFARIILAPNGPITTDRLRNVALSVRAALCDRNLDCILAIDAAGATILIPFDDAPSYEEVRAWLHEITGAWVLAHADVFGDSAAADAVHVNVGSNAVGRWSALPYAVRGTKALDILTPVAWTNIVKTQIATLARPPLTNTFGEEVARIGKQRFAGQSQRFVSLRAGVDATQTHNHVVDALKQLMADAGAHAAEDLCKAGISAKLLPATTKPDYIVNAVRGLIGRQTLRGERPIFVELVDGRFRLNVPVNPFASDAQPAIVDRSLDELIARIRAAATRKIAPTEDDKGNEGAPFERAVADAFSRLGFMAIRDGRHAAPDVVAIAPLGATAYTVAIECKSFDGLQPHVQYVSASEASRFRDQICAKYAILIGAGFPGDKPLDDELAKHSVALWTVEDLVTILQADLAHRIQWPLLEALMTAGRASERIADFGFEHLHGRQQRARICLAAMLEEGLAYQKSLSEADTQVTTSDAHLSISALTMLVNQRLTRQNDIARVNEADIVDAIAIATSPLVGAAYQSETSVTIVSRWNS